MSKIDIYISDIRSNSADYSNLRLLSEKLVIFFLKYWLVIDMVNGYLMKNGMYFPGGFSLGEISRITFLIVFILSFRLKKNKVNLFLILLPMTLLAMSFLHYLILDPQLGYSINISIRLSLAILIFLFIKENLYNDRELIIKIIKTNSIILIFNIALSLLGFGFFTYNPSGGISFGGKGFFFAGNEVAAVILVTYAFFIYIYKKKPLAMLFITFIYLLASFVTLTRASIFGVTLVFIVSVLLYQKKYRFFILSISFFIISFMTFLLKDYIMLAINRAAYFIGQSGFLTFMTGGGKRWREAHNQYMNMVETPQNIIIGSGWTGLAEQNLIDLVGGFGLIGASVYLIWFYLAAYSYKNLREIFNQRYVMFVYLLIFGIATLAGHVMNSAMLAPFVAIFGNLHLLSNEKRMYTKKISK